jgi:hypothetical protein
VHPSNLCNTNHDLYLSVSTGAICAPLSTGGPQPGTQPELCAVTVWQGGACLRSRVGHLTAIMQGTHRLPPSQVVNAGPEVIYQVIYLFDILTFGTVVQGFVVTNKAGNAAASFGVDFRAPCWIRWETGVNTCHPPPCVHAAAGQGSC